MVSECRARFVPALGDFISRRIPGYFLGMKKDYVYSPKSIPTEQYFALAKKFNPSRFDPDKILSAAKEAGFRYAVLTTRHHDAYCLWPSMYGEFNTRNYMDGRDLVGEYVAACRNNGIKVGFYYSPPDFYSVRQYKKMGWGEDEPVPEVMNNYVNAIRRGQIYELLHNYGKIDLIWFDGNRHTFVTDDEIHEWQPGIVIGRGDDTDFMSRECTIPSEEEWENHLKGQTWELCHEASQCWGYTNRDEWACKPAQDLIGYYVFARKHNGNLLLNFGPSGEGELSDLEYQRIRELGEFVNSHPEYQVQDWDPSSKNVQP